MPFRQLEKKRLFFLTLTVSSGIFFLFFLLEIYFRVGNLAPQLIEQPFFSPHKKLPYLFTPNYHFKGMNHTNEFSMDAHVNDLGFLDENWEVKKPDNEIRIIFIGDSFTAGIAREAGVEYTNEVERQLKKRIGPSKVNVLNMGVAGFFPESERMVLDIFADRYSPDAVVVNFMANDVLDASRGIEAVRLGESGQLRARHEEALGSFATKLYIHSHFLRWALKILILNQLPQNNFQDNLDEVYEIKGRYFEFWEKNFDEYRLMKKYCEKKSIPMYLVYLCLPKSWEDAYQHVEEYVKKFCDQERIKFISSRSELNELAKKELIYYPKDGHYQDNANQVVANKVVKILLESVFKIK